MSFNLTDPRTGKTKNIFDDFGGRIINTNETTYDRECMPQLNFITDKNDNRDGEIFIGGALGTRVIEMTCFFSEEDGGGDLSELKRWLFKQHNNKKLQQIFEWDGADDNSAILAIESGGWQSKVYYQKKFYGEIPLKFICHSPYYFIKDEKDILFTGLKAGDMRNIRCAGNTESYPLIKIVPNGTQSVIQFNWNGLIVTLNNVDKPIYLDCWLSSCYEYISGIITPTNKCNTTLYKDFPLVDADLPNSITVLQGNFDMIITLNSRII